MIRTLIALLLLLAAFLAPRCARVRHAAATFAVSDTATCTVTGCKPARFGSLPSHPGVTR